MSAQVGGSIALVDAFDPLVPEAEISGHMLLFVQLPYQGGAGFFSATGPTVHGRSADGAVCC